MVTEILYCRPREILHLKRKKLPISTLMTSSKVWENWCLPRGSSLEPLTKKLFYGMKHPRCRWKFSLTSKLLLRFVINFRSKSYLEFSNHDTIIDSFPKLQVLLWCWEIRIEKCSEGHHIIYIMLRTAFVERTDPTTRGHRPADNAQWWKNLVKRLLNFLIQASVSIMYQTQDENRTVDSSKQQTSP